MQPMLRAQPRQRIVVEGRGVASEHAQHAAASRCCFTLIRASRMGIP
jgi:hypothetical protein